MAYLCKRYKCYWSVCWKHKLPDGRWITKAKSLKTTNKSIAKKRFDLQYSDGIGMVKECDLRDWMEKYKYELKNNNQKKLGSLAFSKYVHDTGEFCNFMDGKVFHLSQITRDHVNDFIKKLTGKNYSQSTISGYKRSLRKMFRIAMVLELIRKNPMENMPIPSSIERTKFFFQEEIRKILEAASDNDYQTALALFFLQTGFRISEVTRASWEYINHSNKTIQVLGKGNKYRIQKLPARLYEAVVKIKTDRSLIFGKSLKQIERDIKGVLNTARIDGNSHDFRRSYATYSMQVMPMDVLRNRMGHSSLQQLDKYTRGFNQEIAPDIKELFNDWQIK